MSLIEPVRLVLTPHPRMKVLNRADGPLVATQVMTEVMTGKFPVKAGEFRDLLVELSLGNLWFFLKVVAGYNGPYDKLTDHLHRDMANFYQEWCLEPGSRSALFIARSHFKSSVVTHGANTWELTRDPDLTIGLGSEKIDRSREFLSYTARTFTDNEFFAWLFPEHVVKDGEKGRITWNADEITLPSKTRNFDKPSIKTLSVGGATAGVHVDLLKFDDIVGDSLLNAEHSSGAEMLRIAHWAHSNINTLVNDMVWSRVFWTGTRYAIEDPYERVMTDVKVAVGDGWDEIEEEKYQVKKDGTWTVYYRMAREKGRIIFPEAIRESLLDKMQREDPWTYYTQYQNNPMKGGLNELVGMTAHPCNLDLDQGGWFVHFWDPKTRERKEVRLADCDVVQATDPAASEKKMSARTSRSAHVLVARDWEDRVFVLKVYADYVKITEVLDWMFQEKKRMGLLVRATLVEMQGPFKVLRPVIEEEERRRKAYLGLQAVSAGSDKDVRIRTQLVPFMEAGRFFVVESDLAKFQEEQLSFPGGSKKDILDAVATALAGSVRPENPEDVAEAEIDDMIAAGEVNRVTGY